MNSDPLARISTSEAPNSDAPLFQLREAAVALRPGEARQSSASTQARATRARGRRRECDRIRILGLLVVEPLSCDEVAAALDKQQSSISGRFSELRKLSYITPTGATRRTRSGGDASVWSITAEGLRAAAAAGVIAP